MSPAEARALFMAAVQAVAPKAITPGGSSARTAGDLLAWLSETDVATLLHRLSDAEREDLLVVLRGMMQERAVRRPATPDI